MLTPTLNLAGDSSPDKAVEFAGQVRRYYRCFQRLLRARPSDLQRSAMEAAAYAAARYDRALRDHTLGASSLAHYERVQRKALAAMHAIFKRAPAPELTLEQILHSNRYGAGDDT